MVRLAGGTPKFIPLRPPTNLSESSSSKAWSLDYEELDAMFTSKTKGILVNNPNNPLGKVFCKSHIQNPADPPGLPGVTKGTRLVHPTPKFI